MKKTFLLIILCAAQFTFAQVTLEGNKLMKDGIKYKYSKYEEVFQNEEAKSYFKKARENKTAGEIFGIGGGAMLGLGLSRLLSGKNNDVVKNPDETTFKKEDRGWGFIIAGAGLVGIGIPFAIGEKRNKERALKMENGEKVSFQPYFKVETAGNGLALSYNF